MPEKYTRSSKVDHHVRDTELEFEVPVFRPTFEEFQDFEGFMKKVEKDERAIKLGLVKVIPPFESWKWKVEPNAFESRKEEKERKIQPVKQFISGRKGCFRIDLVESKKRTVGKFMQDASKQTAKRPSLARQPKRGIPLFVGEMTQDSNQIFIWKGFWGRDKKTVNAKEYNFTYNIVQGVDIYNQQCFVATGTYDQIVDEENRDGVVDDKFYLFKIPHVSNDNDEKCHIEGYGCNDVVGEYLLSGEFEEVSPSKFNVWVNRTIRDEEEQEEYHDNEMKNEVENDMKQENKNTATNDYNDGGDHMETNVKNKTKLFDVDVITNKLNERDFNVLESGFWKALTTTSTPPMYGGDQAGTIFDNANCNGWNLNKLDTILRMGFKGKEAKGITNSMLYFGMWRAMFAWHTEDMELNSVNYLHYGAPKIWYSILPGHAKRFENLAKAEFGDEANRCYEFIRHKNLMVSPSVLRREKIPYVRAIQKQGEFMFTFPRSYHGGFNAGFNVAEAVNFATPRWLEFGRKARWCKCEKWTFRIDVDDFVDTIRETDSSRLPNEPMEGDRVWIEFEEFADDEMECDEDDDDKTAGNKEEANKKTVQKNWYFCRLKKGRAGAKFVAIPIEKETCPFSSLLFNPETDTWEHAVKGRNRALELKKNRDRVHRVSEELRQARRQRWKKSLETRKKRRLVRKAKSLMQNPLLVYLYVSHTRAVELAKSKASPTPAQLNNKSKTKPLVPPSRLEKLQYMKSTRQRRLKQRKEREIKKQVSQVISAMTESIITNNQLN